MTRGAKINKLARAVKDYRGCRDARTGERFGNASINGQMCNDCQGTGLVTQQHYAQQHQLAFPTTSTQEAMAAAAQGRTGT